MSLINDQQKKNAGTDESTTVKVPVAKPAASTPSPEAPIEFNTLDETSRPLSGMPIEGAYIEEFEQPLREAQATEQTNESSFNISDAIRPGASSEPILPQAQQESVTPYTPQIELWQDITVGSDEFKINAPRDVATKRPTLFEPWQEPSNAAGEQSNHLYTHIANRYLSEAQKIEAERVSKSNEIISQGRTQLKNTPDVGKPWHETTWDGITGALSIGLFGSEEAQRLAEKEKEFNPLAGQFGVHGSGVGGMLKYALSVPVAVTPFIYSEIAEESIKRQEKKLSQENARFAYNGRSVPYNKLPDTEKRRIANDKFNNAWVGGIRGYYGYEGRDTIKALTDILTGQTKGDDVNDPNPFLEPVDGAVVERPKGTLFSRDRKPGQPWYEDKVGATLETLNQLFNPGNKVDVAGQAIGTVVGKIGGSVFKGVDNIVFGGAVSKRMFNRQADAILDATRPPDTRGRPGVIVPNAGSEIQPPPGKQTLALPPGRQSVPANKLTQAGLELSENVKLPEPVPTPAARPINIPALKYADIFSDEAIDFSENVGKLDVGIKRPPELDPFSDEFAETFTESFTHQPVHPTAFKRKPVIPGGGAIDVIEKAGVLQPGEVIDFIPTVLPRNHDDTVAFLRGGSPIQRAFMDGYNGKSWDDLTAWTAKSGGDYVNSVGTVLDGFPISRVTLDDLITQARDLAATKNALEQNAELLQKYFDETIDFGRRALNELPIEKTSIEEVEKILRAQNQLLLAPAAMETFDDAAKIAIKENNTAAIAETVTREAVEEAVQVHNASLEATQRVTEYATKSIIKPPVEVIHGTAIKGWSPDYNIAEFGSRGELGSGLYTTTNITEAQQYARALVGENVSSNARYAEIEPNITTLDTSGFKATLDASKRVPKSVLDSVKQEFPELVLDKKVYSYKSLVSDVERKIGRIDASEGNLQRANRVISNKLRQSGYDSVYDKSSGWFLGIDNAKFKIKQQTIIEPPASAMESTVARYNVDTTAAKEYPSHLTSASNLADSNYKLVQQTKAAVDDALFEVQEKAVKKIAAKTPEPVVAIKKVTKAASTLVNNLAKGDVNNAVALLKQFGNAIELPLATRGKAGNIIVESNLHTLRAAQQLNKRQLDVVVKKADGTTSIQAIPLKELKDVSYKETQQVAYSKVELAKQAMEGKLTHPPVYEYNTAGVLVPTASTDDISVAAKATGRPFEAIVIQKGRAKVATVDGDNVILRDKPKTKAKPKPKEVVKAEKKSEDLIRVRDAKAKAKTITPKDDEELLKSLDKLDEVKKTSSENYVKEQTEKLKADTAELKEIREAMLEGGMSVKDVDKRLKPLVDSLEEAERLVLKLTDTKVKKAKVKKAKVKKAKVEKAKVEEAPSTKAVVEEPNVTKLERVDYDDTSKLIDDLPDEFEEVVDKMPTDEELMRIDADLYEDAQFNPTDIENLDELYASIGDSTICRY